MSAPISKEREVRHHIHLSLLPDVVQACVLQDYQQEAKEIFALCMKTHVINVTAWQPGNMAHIKQVLKAKHGKEVKILYRAGGEVTYLV